MKFGDTKLFIVAMVVAVALGWWADSRAFYANESQPLNFSHATHAEKAGLTCQDCHGFLENGAFTGIPTLEQCSSCHAEVTGTTEDERRFVEEYVKKNKEVPWRVIARQPDNAYFSHIFHVKTAGLDCTRCHGQHGTTTTLRPLQVNIVTGYSRDIEGSRNPGIFGKPSDGMLMGDCIDCHDEHARQSACIDCHK